MAKSVSISGLATVLIASAAFAAPGAIAQEASHLSEFERPIGWDYGSESRAYDADTKDLHGNRVVINGLIQGGSSLGRGLNTGWGQTEGSTGMLGSGLAAGNQLNVVTNGSNNVIIIDSTQINNGDQTVVMGGE